jgi:hypothetical protein
MDSQRAVFQKCFFISPTIRAMSCGTVEASPGRLFAESDQATLYPATPS